MAETLEDLLEIYRKYNEGKYDIGDVSRIISYISFPQVSEEEMKKVEDEIELIRFFSVEKEQKDKVNKLLAELIEKVDTGKI